MQEKLKRKWSQVKVYFENKRDAALGQITQTECHNLLGCLKTIFLSIVWLQFACFSLCLHLPVCDPINMCFPTHVYVTVCISGCIKFFFSLALLISVVCMCALSCQCAFPKSVLTSLSWFFGREVTETQFLKSSTAYLCSCSSTPFDFRPVRYTVCFIICLFVSLLYAVDHQSSLHVSSRPLLKIISPYLTSKTTKIILLDSLLQEKINYLKSTNAERRYSCLSISYLFIYGQSAIFIYLLLLFYVQLPRELESTIQDVIEREKRQIHQVFFPSSYLVWNNFPLISLKLIQTLIFLYSAMML